MRVERLDHLVLTVADIDASCLDRLAAAPPFAGNYGWEP